MMDHLERIDEAKHLRTDQDVVSAGGSARVGRNASELIVQPAPERGTASKIDPSMILNEGLQSRDVIQVGIHVTDNCFWAPRLAVHLRDDGLEEMLRITGSSCVAMGAGVAIAIRKDSCNLWTDVEGVETGPPTLERIHEMVGDRIDEHIVMLFTSSWMSFETRSTASIGLFTAHKSGSSFSASRSPW